jgi:hypothetical protein
MKKSQQASRRGLADNPPFTAISYTWGDEYPVLPIQIDGSRVTVRFNCWHALWQVRHHQKDRHQLLWIDSICIDQNSKVEKAAQVALMGDIYAAALGVASCIGQGNELERLGLGESPAKIEISQHLLESFERKPYFGRT